MKALDFEQLPFSLLSAEQRETVAASVMTQDYRAGDAIFREGSPYENVLIIQDGFCRFDYADRSGGVITVGIFGPGDFCDFTLSEDVSSPVSGVTVTPLHAQLVPKSVIMSMIRSNLNFFEGYLALQDAVRQLMISLIANAVAIPAEARLARTLMTLNRLFGVGTETRLGQVFTQESLARMGGSSRQNISKIINKWKADGLISHRYGWLQIIDLKGLSKSAQWDYQKWRSQEVTSSHSILMSMYD